MLYAIPGHILLQAGGPDAGSDGNGGSNLFGLVAQFSDAVIWLVFILLILFSVICWVIIIYKWLYMFLAQSESAKFLKTFWESKRLDTVYETSEKLSRSPLAHIFKAGYTELSKIKGNTDESNAEEGMHDKLSDIDSIERSLRRAKTNEITSLESMVPFLATTGSTAPFIGLFGTVLGIVGSFHEIGERQGAGFEIVAPGLADALAATAVGLVAAIPAVIAYNYFVRRIRVIASEMEAFTNDYLNIIQRHFLK